MNILNAKQLELHLRTHVTYTRKGTRGVFSIKVGTRISREAIIKAVRDTRQPELFFHEHPIDKAFTIYQGAMYS